jgi:Kef-type K+ transport system membrane component KefB
MDMFFEIGLLVIFAGLGTYVAKLTKQPLIPAYIVSGIIVGRLFSIGADHEIIAKLSEIGIAFLLFMVGLELEMKKLKDIGLVSSVVGTMQMVAVFALGYLAVKLLGFTSMEAVYLSLVVAFSSTMLVVKLLSDKLETNTLHGRLMIGVLVIQDIFAIIALSYLASTASPMTGYVFLAKIVLAILFGLLASKFIFPRVFEFAASSRELLLSVSLSVCFLFAMIFQAIGLSITIGAFVAGVLLANLPYNIEIVGRIKPLRDFFSILFFTSLGLQLVLDGISSLVIPIAVLLLLTMVAKPLVLHIALLLMGHKGRTSFLAATSLGQISEFSLILVIQGISLGVLRQGALTMTVMLALITMAFTSYFMSYEDGIYKYFLSLLKRSGLNVRRQSKSVQEKKAYDVVLCGYDRIGYSVLKALKEQKKSVVVVDFNPDVIKRLQNTAVPCIYGDVCDPEVMDRLDMTQAKMVISTANAYEDNLLLLQKVKAANSHVPTIVTAHKIEQALELYENGADYVILPHFLGGDMVANMLPGFESHQLRMLMLKYRHINDLIERRNVGHEHPMQAGR